MVLTMGVVAASSYGVQLNEIFLNPPGTDNGQEFFELRGTVGESLSNMWFLVIEGDSTAAGVVDVAIDLTGNSMGSNGLFLRRDAATNIAWNNAQTGYSLMTGPDAGTNVAVGDFSPDLENGSETFLLVSGFTGVIGTDLDAGNDGTLDSTPWASISDALGFLENDGASNTQYATSLGYFGFATNAEFNSDVMFRANNFSDGTPNTWFGADVIGTNPGGPYTVDPTRFHSQNPLGPIATAEIAAGNLWTATPGGHNPVPEPATMIALAAGAVAVIRKRRK
jgi:hypothetical protein